MVIPNDEVKNKVMSLLSEHLIYQEKPERYFVDTLIDWFSKLIPDDDEHVTASSFHLKQAQLSP
jgi:hypothetical protein